MPNPTSTSPAAAGRDGAARESQRREPEADPERDGARRAPRAGAEAGARSARTAGGPRWTRPTCRAGAGPAARSSGPAPRARPGCGRRTRRTRCRSSRTRRRRRCGRAAGLGRRGRRSRHDSKSNRFDAEVDGTRPTPVRSTRYRSADGRTTHARGRRRARRGLPVHGVAGVLRQPARHPRHPRAGARRRGRARLRGPRPARRVAAPRPQRRDRGVHRRTAALRLPRPGLGAAAGRHHRGARRARRRACCCSRATRDGRRWSRSCACRWTPRSSPPAGSRTIPRSPPCGPAGCR